MGRKSSAKAQSRTGTGAAPPPDKSARSFTPLLAVAVVVAVIAGIFVYTRRSEPTAAGGTQASSTPAAPVIVDPPVNAKYGPHPQENLPPLPFEYGPPARPAEVVKAVYEFAAEHPEVLGYVPCYCGCEREAGHRGNDDCFVAERNSKGDVTRWDPHGVT
jgi:Protein of unknown function with PCYCGC motif